MYLTPKRCS